MTARPAGIIVAACLLIGAGVSIDAYSGSSDPSADKKETSMSTHARGPFDVKLAPQKPDNPQAEGSGLGRMSIDKQFHGDLEATSQGEMLAMRTEVANSAGYVAIERVTGTLGGRSGSFVLQHSSTMNRGAASQNINVVPDSGTGELKGLAGAMTITIAEGGKHAYDFNYTLD